MKIKIVKNKYLNAMFLLMLFSATVHMLILFYLAIATKDFYLLNYFHIIDITVFMPWSLNTFWGNFMATIFALCVYLIILKINKAEDEENSNSN